MALWTTPSQNCTSRLGFDFNMKDASLSSMAIFVLRMFSNRLFDSPERLVTYYLAQLRFSSCPWVLVDTCESICFHTYETKLKLIEWPTMISCVCAYRIYQWLVTLINKVIQTWLHQSLLPWEWVCFHLFLFVCSYDDRFMSACLTSRVCSRSSGGPLGASLVAWSLLGLAPSGLVLTCFWSLEWLIVIVCMW